MTDLQWCVKHRPELEEVLAMIRNRDVESLETPKSMWFDNLQEAEEYQFTESLRTGKTYTLVHRTDMPELVGNQVRKLLRADQ